MILFCLYLRVTQLRVQVCYKQAKKWQEAGDACANPLSLTSTPLFTTPNPCVYNTKPLCLQPQTLLFTTPNPFVYNTKPLCLQPQTPVFTTPNPFVYRWIRYKKCAEMMLEMKNDFDASNHFLEAAVHDP
jgi:hypothetical protein